MRRAALYFKNGIIIKDILFEVDDDELSKIRRKAFIGFDNDVEFALCFNNITIRGSELIAIDIQNVEEE